MHPFPSKATLGLLAHLCVSLPKREKKKKRGKITKNDQKMGQKII
jgi:hypothetical protein